MRLFGIEIIDVWFGHYETPPVEAPATTPEPAQPPGYSSHMGGSFEHSYTGSTVAHPEQFGFAP